MGMLEKGRVLPWTTPGRALPRRPGSPDRPPLFFVNSNYYLKYIFHLSSVSGGFWRPNKRKHRFIMITNTLNLGEILNPSPEPRASVLGRVEPTRPGHHRVTFLTVHSKVDISGPQNPLISV